MAVDWFHESCPSVFHQTGFENESQKEEACLLMCNQNRKRNYFTQSPSPCYCGPAGVNVDTRVKPKWTDGRSLNGEQAGVVTKTVSLLIRVWIISLPPPVILLIHSILSFYKSDYLSVVVALCWPRQNICLIISSQMSFSLDPPALMCSSTYINHERSSDSY